MWRLLALAALLGGCGVKQPPIAPQARPLAVVPAARNLDCSPTDEHCDKKDPNYVPRGSAPVSH